MVNRTTAFPALQGSINGKPRYLSGGGRKILLFYLVRQRSTIGYRSFRKYLRGFLGVTEDVLDEAQGKICSPKGVCWKEHLDSHCLSDRLNGHNVKNRQYSHTARKAYLSEAFHEITASSRYSQSGAEIIYKRRGICYLLSGLPLFFNFPP